MKFRTAAALTAGVVGILGVLGLPPPAGAKSAYWEIRGRCPCAGPTARTFWTSVAARMACVDGVIDELRGEWAEEILARDRRVEERSRCGVPRFQCDGTAERPCPGRTVCELTDPFCGPDAVAGVCMPARALRRAHGCRLGPPACGCDGRTYATACRLWREGAVLAHEGSCAEGCAGPDGLACGAGTYCLAPSCGDGGAWGFCAPVPAPCQGSGPVCGCDGRTHLSPCAAYGAGVGIRHLGPCASD